MRFIARTASSRPSHGKHVICEKPIAISLAECDRMIAAADAAGVQLLQGHSKIFDSPNSSDASDYRQRKARQGHSDQLDDV